MVVDWVDEHGSRVVTYGQTALAGGWEVNGQTLFEIGSVTKVFTALLVAQSVERQVMKLDDPVAKYLRPGIRLPTCGGRQITLLDLATHHSGLPSIPSNMQPADAGNPSAGYTPEQMFSFLSGYELTRDIGSQFEYSNLGTTKPCRPGCTRRHVANTMDRRDFLKTSSAGTIILGIGLPSLHLLAFIDAAQDTVSMPAHDGVNDPSALAGVKAVLFDTFGTVVDWRGSLTAQAVALGRRRGMVADWTRLVDGWRDAYRPSLERVRSGQQPWTNLDDLQRQSLDRLVAEQKIAGLTEDDLHDLMDGWHRLEP